MIFYWRDQLIEDIEKWTADRKEKMADVVWNIKDINPYTRKAKDMISYHEEKESMPEIFLKTIRFNDNRTIKSYKLREPKISKKKKVLDNDYKWTDPKENLGELSADVIKK